MTRRNQSEFLVTFDNIKQIAPVAWKVTTTEDAAAGVEFSVDTRQHPEVIELYRNSLSKPEPLQFQGVLFLSGSPKINYNLVLAGVSNRYSELMEVVAVVKQFTFDRPVALKDEASAKQATGGYVTGDLQQIFGGVAKTGLFGTELRKIGASVTQRPDGSILIVSQNGGEYVVTRSIPYPKDTINYVFGIKQSDEKAVANQAEVDTKSTAVTGVGRPTPIGKDDSEESIIAKKVYAAFLSRGAKMAFAVVAYHCTECNSYKDARKIQNGGKSLGILQWTRDGCENIAAFQGTTNSEKFGYIKRNISNVDLQIQGLVQYYQLWEGRGAPAQFRAKLSQLPEAKNDIEKEFMVYAGTIYYPGFGAKSNPWDSKIGANNVTLRQVATGTYKMKYALKEAERLLN